LATIQNIRHYRGTGDCTVRVPFGAEHRAMVRASIIHVPGVSSRLRLATNNAPRRECGAAWCVVGYPLSWRTHRRNRRTQCALLNREPPALRWSAAEAPTETSNVAAAFRHRSRAFQIHRATHLNATGRIGSVADASNIGALQSVFSPPEAVNFLFLYDPSAI
jgi:hypothetical protein